MGLVNDQISELRRTIGEVVAGNWPVRSLEEVATRLGEELPAGDEPLDALWGRVELLLAERSMGHLDDDELRAELAVDAPIPVLIGPAPRSSLATRSAARTVRTILEGLVGPPQVAADTRSVEALA